MANHRGVKRTLPSKRSIYRKQNGKCTDVTNRIYRSLLTISHFPGLLDFLVDTHIADAETPVVFNCLTWSFIMASRARQATIIMKTGPASLFIRDITRGKSRKMKLSKTGGKDWKGTSH